MNKKLNLRRALIAISTIAITIIFVYALGKVVLSVQDNPDVAVFAPDIDETDIIEITENTINTIYKPADIQEKKYDFDDGGVFRMYRIFFGSNVTEASEYTREVMIDGEILNIYWQNYDAAPKWEHSQTINNLPKATLFIETTKENVIISIPALYYEKFDHATIEALPERENAATIEKTDAGGYKIVMRFSPLNETIGEYWYYKTSEALSSTPISEGTVWLAHDLHKNRRFCFDGYYFDIYTSYSPYAENGFFRNPANYTGAYIIRSEKTGSLRNLGYAMTMICMENQNEYGFWATGPKSSWLETDYGITYGFYDTRFSTDFARSLIEAYTTFKDEYILASAKKYAQFLLDYTMEHGFNMDQNGKKGVLLPDYWSETQTKKPHVSLNHQLAELNFLLELYEVTNDSQYYDLAKSMLHGIEIMADSFINEDGNLNYAILYDTTSIEMVDYPYLSYNDLFDTNELLKKFSESSEEILKLMDVKKKWMDANNITQYKR